VHRAHVQSLAPSHQDSAGNIYVAGTSGRNFPSTPGSPFGGSAAASVFLAKINPATGLLYSYPIPGLSGKVAVALMRGSTPAQVQYAGSSPTEPSGVFQINFVVPPVGTYSSTHTVDVTIGPGYTNPLQTVTIAIGQ
jgi:hypothetical protein